MSHMLLEQEVKAAMPFLSEVGIAVKTGKLNEDEREEVLTFLAQRPIHTVVMAGWIRDNGLVSPLNRGTFYGCRNDRGQLEGVALIGHVTLMEVRTRRALEVFARIAQDYAGTHLLMGEQERIREFCATYSEKGQPVRRASRETLFEVRSPVTENSPVQGLRLATMDDLHLVIPAQAQMAFEESGVDPREVDSQGFRERCARRIEQGRVWILLDKGELIFKAELIGKTPDVFYLEGVYVAPHARRKGLGTGCMKQLSNHLLNLAPSICVLVNHKNPEAHSFYRKAGFEERGTYDTIFLGRKQPGSSLTETHEMNASTETRPLTERDRSEVLEFLSEQPARTVIMAGLIYDHGLQNQPSGGTFYGYWNSRATLEGVALIGRMTMFETRSNAAIRAFADVARRERAIKMVMAEDEELEKFWEWYRTEEQTPRLSCQEVLYEYDGAAAREISAAGLRRATIEHLDQVVMAHAGMVQEESGVNPLEADPEGFRERCARRIEQGRVWVLIREGELLFKADLVAETPKSAYLEGLWVNPAYRHKGVGRRSVAELRCALTAEKSSLSGFVNARNFRAQAFYEQAGCAVRARFGKIYL